MSPRRARRVIKPAEVRQAELLEAASHLFEERGFEQVTVSDIAAAAKVAKGTFYLYFESKEQLLDALRHRLTEAAIARIAELEPPADGDWADFTNRLVRQAIAFQVEQYDLHELVRQPHRHGDSGAPGHGTDGLRMALRRIVDAGASAGAYVVGDPSVAVGLIYDLLHGAGDRACLHPEEREAIADEASAFVRRALLRS